MDNRVEYLIDVTAVYFDGTRDSILIRQRDVDGEAARNAVSNFFRSYQKTYRVMSLTTTLVEYESGKQPAAR